MKRSHYYYHSRTPDRKRFWGGDEEETGRQEQTSTQTTTPTEYPQAEGARENWWQTLQQWGADPMYGAITPNFEDIYTKAAKRVNQYYWGGASGQPGLIDKIRAQAAQRGVQDSPATGVLTQRAGAEQAQQLGDISTNVDTLKASAGETARSNWMTSLMNLARLKTGGSTTTGQSTTTVSQPETDVWDALGTIGGGLATGLGYGMGGPLDGGIMASLSSLLKPQKTQTSLTDRGVTNAFSIPGVY